MDRLPALPPASSRPPTKRDSRLERLIRAGEAFYAARSRYHAYDGDDPREEDQLCDACGRARLAFAQACERFFLNPRHPV